MSDSASIYTEITPTSANLNVLPITIEDITTLLPYTKTLGLTTQLEPLLIYQVSGITANEQQEISLTLDGTFPVATTFYVVSDSRARDGGR